MKTGAELKSIVNNSCYIPANVSWGILKKLCFRGNAAEEEEIQHVDFVDKYMIHRAFVICL